MTEKKASHFDSSELRRKAEERLGEDTGKTISLGSQEDQLRLLHELQVHQIELEMQNEELRQARDDEATAREKYTDLYDFAPVGYLTLDSIGNIRAANLTGSSLMGCERSMLIGRRFEHFITTKTRSVFSAFLGKVFTTPAKVDCEVSLLREGNSELFVQIEGVAAVLGEECRIAMIDITERKRAEEVLRRSKETEEALRHAKTAEETLCLAQEAVEALSRAKEQSDAVARAKSMFFANMSHELRTPMAGILGMLQLALQEDLAPAPRHYMETSLRSAQSLLRILNDILDMSKIEAGKLIIEENPFSLRECLTEAVEIIISEVQRKGIDLIFTVSEEVPDTFSGDQARLRQVLINLIGNAIKFTEEGKVEVRATAGRMTSDGKREITIAVTDTGIGIPEDKKEILFQTFSQADDSHSRIYGGSGLGLSICREIVELMGGTISFVSERGVGSTFSFTVPLGESNTLPSDESPLPVTTFSEPEGDRIPHLLLCEDDPTIQEILEKMLSLSGYNLDVAKDGQKALEMWGKGEYDLVLMDVQMPRLSGFDVTSAIRKKEKELGGHTPIIAMTAHAGKQFEKQCLDVGMDAYISKPVDFMKCLHLIKQTINKKSC